MKAVLLIYFVRRITAAVLLLWFSLWALLVFFELLRSDADSLLAAAPLVILKSPRLAMETLPFVCAIGAAVAIRRMVSEGAIAILRTSGLSPAMIVCFQLAAALPFFCMYLLLSEVLLPGGADAARAITNKTGAVHGLWLADDTRYIRIQKITNSGAMLSVVIYHTSGSTLTGITRAQRADYTDDAWRLHTINHIENRNGVLTQQVQEQAAWQLPIKPSSFNALTARPREMSLRAATRAAAELSAAGQYSNDLYKTIWRRGLTLPALFLLTALGICFIGGDRRQRYAVSLPVLQALLVSGVYIISRDIFIQTATLSETPLLLALPPLALTAYIIYSVRRAGMV